LSERTSPSTFFDALGERAEVFAQSALHELVQSPIDSLMQLESAVRGSAQPHQFNLIAAPETDSLPAVAGRIAGSVVQFAILSKVTRASLGACGLGMRENGTARALQAALVGTACEFLHPLDGNRRDNFWTSKAADGATAFGTFFSMSKVTNALNAGVDPLERSLGRTVLTNSIGGAVGGVAHAQLKSLSRNLSFATADEVLRSSAEFAYFGGLFGVADHFFLSGRSLPAAEQQKFKSEPVSEKIMPLVEPLPDKVPAVPKSALNKTPLDELRRQGITEQAPEPEPPLSETHSTMLRSICGSRAHGTATATSDFDMRTVYVERTPVLLSLDYRQPKQVKVAGVDETAWELGKFLELSLRSNPTTLEVLAAPVERCTLDGKRLRELFPAFLSRQQVAMSFDGFAKNQRKLLDRVDAGDKPKALAHYLRVLFNGVELLETGQMTVRIAETPIGETVLKTKSGLIPRDTVFAIASELQANLLGRALRNSVLPEQPDRTAINEFLLRIRKDHW
jgi:hypothetical protein